MNQHEAQQNLAASQLQIKANSLVATYEHEGDYAGERLAVLMRAAENEIADQCKSSSLVLVHNSYIQEAAKYIRRGGIIPVDIETTSKLVVLLSNILESHIDSDANNAAKSLPVIDMAAPGAAAALVALSKEKQS